MDAITVGAIAASAIKPNETNICTDPGRDKPLLFMTGSTPAGLVQGQTVRLAAGSLGAAVDRAPGCIANLSYVLVEARVC